MIPPGVAEGYLEALLVLVVITGAFVVTRKDLLSLVSAYRIQSLFLSLVAFSLYAINPSAVLLELAVLTVLSKVILIPYVIQRVQKRINISRDLEFHYLSPTQSIFVTMLLVLLVYSSMSRILRELSLSNLFYLGAVFGVSLALMGMMITFTRKKAITKIIGYLTMENGVLLFSLFLVELPFIIEVLIMVDLLMIVLLATILSIGIDSSIEEFQERFSRFQMESLQKTLQPIHKRLRRHE